MITSWLEFPDTAVVKTNIDSKGNLSIFSDYGDKVAEASKIKQRQRLILQLPVFQNEDRQGDVERRHVRTTTK